MTLQIREAQDKVITDFKKACQDKKLKEPDSNHLKVVEISTITSTLGGIEVPMLTITDFSHTTSEERKKKIIVMTGRVHPGESNSSYIMHGLIKFLLSSDKVA